MRLLPILALSVPTAGLVFACVSNSDNNGPGADGGAPDGSFGADAPFTPPGSDGGLPLADGASPIDGATGGDGGSGDGGSGGGGGPYLYVPPSGGLDTYVFRIDPATGALSGGVPAGPVGKTAGENNAVVAPSGKFYFAINATAGNLSGRVDVYRIDAATGSISPALTADGGVSSFVLPNADFLWVIADPQGHFLYLTDGYAGTNGGNSQIVTLAVDPTTGALSLAATTPMDPFAFESGPTGIALDPDAGCLYTVGYGFAVARIKLDATGIPVPVDAGGATGVDGGQSIGQCTRVVIGARGTAYGICTANAGVPGAGLYAYTYDAASGSLAMQVVNAGGPFAPNGVAVHPNGNFVYTLNNGEIVMFAAPADGGVPTVSSSSDAGLRLSSLRFDGAGSHLYAGGGNSPGHIHVFNVDPSTGALTLADPVDGGVAAGPYPSVDLVVVP